MSFEAMAWAWSQHLPATRKLVLMALANYASREHQTAYPNIKRLARDCGLSPSTTKYAIKDLEQAGYIGHQRQHLESGGLTSNLYRLNLDYRGPIDDLPWSSVDPPGSTDRLARSSVSHQEPVIEPVINDPLIEPVIDRGQRAKRTAASPSDVDTEFLNSLVKQFPNVDMFREHMMWHDHFEAQGWRRGTGAGIAIRNFQASFREWLRRASTWNGRQGQGVSKQSTLPDTGSRDYAGGRYGHVMVCDDDVPRLPGESIGDYNKRRLEARPRQGGQGSYSD